MKVSEFEALLNQLTISDLDKICHEDLNLQFGSYPAWTTGASKSHNIRAFTFWAKGHPDRVAKIVELVEKRIKLNKSILVRGPVPNTYYITWETFTNLPSYEQVKEAVFFQSRSKDGFPSDDINHIYKNNPCTKDGYIAVQGIRNMDLWVCWKVNSVDRVERNIAQSLDKLMISDLMQLNRGRQTNQPALFPERILK